MPVGTPAAVMVGPGLLYCAPVGTAAPTAGTADPEAANWVPLGYTEEGHTMSSEVSYEDIEVAEELNPIRSDPTKRTDMISFAMAEINAQNFSLAHNGGTIGSPSGGTVTFEPPDLGDELFIALLWQAENLDGALLCRKCRQHGTIETARQKAPNKALIPVEFHLFVPDSGAPWTAYLDAQFTHTDPH